MMTSRFSAETLTPEASSCWSRSRLVSSSSSVSPITPFIGVRISWLMVDRNSDFAFDAIRAAVAGGGQILGRLARLGHVAAVEHVAAHRRVGEEVGGGPGDRSPRAVRGGASASRTAAVSPVLPSCRDCARTQRSSVVGMDDVGERSCPRAPSGG